MAIHKNTKHGHAAHGIRTPTYRSWECMLGRCYCKNNPDFRHYGGRGITVCKEWRHNFSAFLDDVGERPKGKTLDRIDSNKSYSKDNCRWATQIEQGKNRRRITFLVYKGTSKSLAEWADTIPGMTYSALVQRMSHGWTVKDALTVPRLLRVAQDQFR